MFLNMSLNFLLGISADDTYGDAPCTSDEVVDAFHDALFLTMVRMIIGRVWKLLPQGRFHRVCNTAHSFLNHYIDQAIGQTGVSDSNPAQSKKMSLAQDLSLQSDDQGFIGSQILQSMMASQETTPSLLGNAFFLLSRHPSYWDQVRNEVLAKGDMLNFDTLFDSKVLQNVLLEIGGGPDLNAPIFVPKGTKAEQYQSEPVGVHGLWGGGRACLGRQKSLVGAAYVLGRLCLNFRGRNIETKRSGEAM
ncbi:hypothetical protein LA080_011505 [Diaporthe eres]|nr:hypothetical protein LA080_011505 [Diaporthe eres]